MSGVGGVGAEPDRLWSWVGTFFSGGVFRSHCWSRTTARRVLTTAGRLFAILARRSRASVQKPSIGRGIKLFHWRNQYQCNGFQSGAKNV
jgi:hypothetical protein